MSNHERSLEGRIKNLEELFLLHQQALEDAAAVVAALYELHREHLFRSAPQDSRGRTGQGSAGCRA